MRLTPEFKSSGFRPSHCFRGRRGQHSAEGAVCTHAVRTSPQAVYGTGVQRIRRGSQTQARPVVFPIPFQRAETSSPLGLEPGEVIFYNILGYSECNGRRRL